MKYAVVRAHMPRDGKKFYISDQSGGHPRTLDRSDQIHKKNLRWEEAVMMSHNLNLLEEVMRS